jgi:hypothetical protein
VAIIAPGKPLEGEGACQTFAWPGSCVARLLYTGGPGAAVVGRVRAERSRRATRGSSARMMHTRCTADSRTGKGAVTSSPPGSARGTSSTQADAGAIERTLDEIHAHIMRRSTRLGLMHRSYGTTVHGIGSRSADPPDICAGNAQVWCLRHGHACEHLFTSRAARGVNE